MKATQAIIFASLALYLYACKKDGDTRPVSVIGKWNIVSISTRGVNYPGQPGDYFNFTANGTLYTKEGAALDTFTYTMQADTAVIMTPPAYMHALSEYGGIAAFTANSLLINGPCPITPGGLMTGGSSISLSR